MGRLGWSLGVAAIVLGWSAPALAQASAPATTGSTSTLPAPPAAPSTSTAPAPGECFPACRSGFTCHAGQCISSCNPPCASGEQCLANGECQSSADNADLDGEEADEEEDEEDIALERRRRRRAAETNEGPRVSGLLREPGRFVFAFRAGFGVISSGTVEDTCDNCTSSGAVTRKTDVIDKSPFMLGLDGLLHATRKLRLGAGYQVIPRSAIATESNKSDSVHLGHEHALRAIVEGVIPLAPRVALALRAQGGLRILAIGGELADRNEEFLKDCENAVDMHCEVDRGALFGSSFGGMASLLGGDNFHWRVDLALDRDILALPTRATRSQNPVPGIQSEVNRTSSFALTRFWVLGGFEL